jgi:ribosome biogenesis GTPase A
VEHKKLVDHFGIDSWKDDEDFIEQVAKNTGKLKKGGEADCHNVATSILNQW